jgi:hypothetical protein
MLRDRKLTFYSHVPNFERAVATATAYSSSAHVLALMKYATLTCQTNAAVAQPNEPLWLKFKFNTPADVDVEQLLIDLEVPPPASTTTTTTTTTIATSTSTAELSAEWPPPHILDAHVKTLCEHIQRSHKASLRDAERQQRQREKATQRRALVEAKRRERQNIWSKREERDLRQAILMFGGGQWSTLKAHAQLTHKNESQIEEYFHNLMALCRQVLSATPHGLEHALNDLNQPRSHRGGPGHTVTISRGGNTSVSRFPFSGDSDSDSEDEDDNDDDEDESDNDNNNNNNNNNNNGDNESNEEFVTMNTRRHSTAPSATASVATLSHGEVDSTSRHVTTAATTPFHKNVETDQREGAPRSSSTTASLAVSSSSERAAEIKPFQSYVEGRLEQIGTNRPNLPVSVTMAKRLLRRVKLLQELRERVYVHPELKKRLDQAHSLDMPSWWVPGMNDLELIKVILTRGLGGKELYDDYLNSDECPLYFAETGKAVYRKHKEKWLREFLQDKPPLLARLSYLVRLVLDGEDAVHQFPYRRSFLADVRREIVTRSHDALLGKRQRDDGVAASADNSEPQKRLRCDDPLISGGNVAHATRPVARDAHGKPILPITIKGITIHDLGTVYWDRPNYHARNYIWPVGFRSTRKMPSIKTPGVQVTYTSLIIDNGDSPGFKVVPEDAPEHTVVCSTASRAFTPLLFIVSDAGCRTQNL